MKSAVFHTISPYSYPQWKAIRLELNNTAFTYLAHWHVYNKNAQMNNTEKTSNLDM